MITQEVHLVLNIAMKEASRMRHEYVLCEHLMYSICFNEQGKRILEKCDVDIGRYSGLIESYLEKKVPTIVYRDGYTPNSSLAIEKVINRAINQALSSEQKSCDVSDILASIIEERECYAVLLLNAMKVDKLKLLRVITEDFSQEKTTAAETEGSNKKDSEFLKKNLVDLVEKAKAGDIDPLVGRAMEMKETLTVLSRRKKNNPILVGEAGVGKTAIVEGLALAIAEKTVHPYFQNSQLYGLEVSSLLAGTKFRGDFEEKMKRLFTLLEKKEKVIVFIDEIHTVVGAGSTSGSQLDVSNLLKPFLTSGTVRCIGATTYKEYRQHFQKDHALQRRFEMIDIVDPSDSDVLEILQRLQSTYENFHSVKYTREALEAMISLPRRYLPDKHLPDAAIDVMDLTAASMKIEKLGGSVVRTVGIDSVKEVISRMSKIPIKSMGKKEKQDLRYLEQRIAKKIFHQDTAVAAVVRAIKLSHSALSEKDKPVASMLFTGPTGVGKTELCRVLSEEIGLKLLRFDMSEFMESHSVSKLIGAPPGYVGYGDMSSQLTEKVKRYPHCLLLLDEIEKAHPDVLNIFLQVMDYGTLSDSLGNKINFKNAILVMTSNAGAKEMASNSIGFLESEGATTRVKEQINATFSPEFRNRLSTIIHFNFLPTEAVREVLQKFVSELNTMLEEKKINISLTPAAVDHMVAKGHDAKMGARPMKRLIEVEIKQAIVDDELFGELVSGGHVRFDFDGEKLVKTILPLEITTVKKVLLPPSPNQKKQKSIQEKPVEENDSSAKDRLLNEAVSVETGTPTKENTSAEKNKSTKK